jgi:hypothetical protein
MRLRAALATTLMLAAGLVAAAPAGAHPAKQMSHIKALTLYGSPVHHWFFFSGRVKAPDECRRKRYVVLYRNGTVAATDRASKDGWFYFGQSTPFPAGTYQAIALRYKVRVDHSGSVHRHLCKFAYSPIVSIP